MVNFEAVYAGRTPLGRRVPWDIGAPQPVLLDLLNRGEIRGNVLDIGCGTGEHSVLLAERGFPVTGVDISATAIRQGERKAADRAVTPRFEVADAFELPGHEQEFDTIIDCGLFDSCPAETRGHYVTTLHRVSRPGARVFLLELNAAATADMRRAFLRTGIPSVALRDLPRLVAADLRTAFAIGWRERFLVESTMRVQWPGAAAPTETSALFGCFERD